MPFIIKPDGHVSGWHSDNDVDDDDDDGAGERISFIVA